MPRLYREAPVSSIWEGSGNVICLDLLRVINRAPKCLESFNTLVTPVLSEQPVLQKRFQKLQQELARCQHEPALLRRCVVSMALLLQCSLLRNSAPESTFHLFVDSRFNVDGSRSYGTLEDISSAREILERAWASWVNGFTAGTSDSASREHYSARS